MLKLALAFCLTTVTFAQTGPTITQANGQHRLVLPSSLSAAVLQFDPNFRPASQSEYAASLLQGYHFTRNQGTIRRYR